MIQSTHLVSWPLTERDTISAPVTLVQVTSISRPPIPAATRRPAIGMIMGPPVFYHQDGRFGRLRAGRRLFHETATCPVPPGRRGPAVAACRCHPHGPPGGGGCGRRAGLAAD